MSTEFPRASGILLHITSLPDPTGPATPGERLSISHPGSGDFGMSAYHFVDWLEQSEQHLWQVLPLVPTGSGYSPYMSPSSLAFNPLLVDLRALVEAGWLPEEFREDDDSFALADPSNQRIDFTRTEHFRLTALALAADNFLNGGDCETHADFTHFCEQEGHWLDDYALFMVLNEQHHGETWQNWPAPLANRQPDALHHVRESQRARYRFWCFVQWQAQRQWEKLRGYANARGIRIIGDLPIFVALNSADTWAAPDLFDLDHQHWPTAVAGVPPDYFSEDGQLWGNPLYCWKAHAEQGYAWWIKRMRRALVMADTVRIDHFRGFSAYWSVAAGLPNARVGQWNPGPREALFEALAAELGSLPLIAEDLGIIDDDVVRLLETTGLPGMGVLQFAFSNDSSNPFLPHNLKRHQIVYTGTHDNDTSLGWFASIGERERARVQVYLKTDGREINWELIHAASQSVATWAIYPMQDVLGLDGSARMNRPGDTDGCWGWRYEWPQLQEWQTRRLRAITQIHGRDAPDWAASIQPAGR
ncbi:MAG: 4-alpha-glucanotransferase [Lautropia sp.]|nr:4-alpha-glucanotransferase [Lautropia sp.]